MSVLDCMLPENAKRRVQMLDVEMWKTNDTVEVAYRASALLDRTQYGNWRETMAQWNAFASDVLSRNDWAQFSYCDVESAAQAFEDKIDVMRDLLHLQRPLRPTYYETRLVDFTGLGYAIAATAFILVVVPKLPGWNDLFGKEGTRSRRR